MLFHSLAAVGGKSLKRIIDQINRNPVLARHLLSPPVPGSVSPFSGAGPVSSFMLHHFHAARRALRLSLSHTHTLDGSYPTVLAVVMNSMCSLR